MSFLDNARRAFGARSEEYYDDERYEDEYEDYEEEPKKPLFSFLSKRSDRDAEYEDEEQYEEESDKSRYSSYSSRSETPKEKFYSGFSKSSSSVPPRSNLSGVEVTVYYPTSLNDATRIIREVKSNKITIIDISTVESDDEARRLVDYIGGASFGMDCPFERLCPSIFCMAPAGVKIDAKKRY